MSFFFDASLHFRRTNGFCTNSSPEGRAELFVRGLLLVLCRVDTPVSSDRDFFDESSGNGMDQIEFRESI